MLIRRPHSQANGSDQRSPPGPPTPTVGACCPPGSHIDRHSLGRVFQRSQPLSQYLALADGAGELGFHFAQPRLDCRNLAQVSFQGCSRLLYPIENLLSFVSRRTLSELLPESPEESLQLLG